MLRVWRRQRASPKETADFFRQNCSHDRACVILRAEGTRNADEVTEGISSSHSDGASTLRLSLLLESGTVHDPHLVALHADQARGAESGEISRHNLPHGSQPGRKFLVIVRSNACAPALFEVSRSSRASLCVTLPNVIDSIRPTRWRKRCPTTAKTLSATSGYWRQTCWKSDLLINKETTDSTARTDAGYGPPSNNGNSATEEGAASMASITSRPAGEVRKILTLP